MKIPFLDLKKINEEYREKMMTSFTTFLDNGWYINGAAVKTFEVSFAKFCDTKYCVGVGNGLDALTLILKGYIGLGKLKKGEKVIVAANTYIATILAIKQAGLIPVLVEPEETTFNLNARLIKEVYDDDVKAILVTHLYGQLANMAEINQIAQENELLVIADAAQAHGARDDKGRTAGNLCHATGFSFYPTKNLGALGDGGAITTNDVLLAEIVRQLANYGMTLKYVSDKVGVNSRLDEIQAYFLIEKLKNLNENNEKRREIAQQYLTSIDNPKIEKPYWNGSENHVFHVFVIRVEDRIDFCSYLDNEEIGYLIHYPIPPHKQKALLEFKELKLPITEKIHNEVVSIPLTPVLKEEEINRIIAVINAY